MRTIIHIFTIGNFLQLILTIRRVSFVFMQVKKRIEKV